MVPLSALTRNESSVAPLSINHQDQFPSVTISFNLAPGRSLGDAVAAIQGDASELLARPRPTRASRARPGSSRSLRPANRYLIAAAILAVYIVLGMLYESFIHPITILSDLPSAGVGALLALMAAPLRFSLIALIGIILLIGIVKKNAIMMIDFALEARAQARHPPAEAIYEACLAALPPDHDDDDGRAPRRPAAGARHGRGLRAPTAPGHRHRRRAAGLADADPLHDAGRLHLHEQDRPTAPADRADASMLRIG